MTQLMQHHMSEIGLMPARGFSHAGEKFLLGYGDHFFAIYDRNERRATPSEPVAIFPRTDEGWAEAWKLFSSWEPKCHPIVAHQATKPHPSTLATAQSSAQLSPSTEQTFAVSFQIPAPVTQANRPIIHKKKTIKSKIRRSIRHLRWNLNELHPVLKVENKIKSKKKSDDPQSV
jgi:hypothetical protein